MTGNILGDNETLLLVAAFYTPISFLWEGTLQNFEPLRKHIFLDMKVNTHHVMGSKYLRVT